MQRSMHRHLVAVAAFLAVAAPAASRAQDWKERFEYQLAPGFDFVPGNYAAGVPDTLVYLPDQDFNFYADVATRNADGTINSVIEIPQGDVRKFETDMTTGRLFWELKSGKPRKVAYLGYPGNYGMVPRTLGGDGDPLDTVVIGAQELRGAISAGKLVGVMRMIDGGDPDDKLLVVVPGSPFDGMTLADLEATGVTAILKTWFERYKGPGSGIQVTAFEDATAADQVLREAEASYAAANPLVAAGASSGGYDRR